MPCMAFHQSIETYSRSELASVARVDVALWTKCMTLWNTPDGFRDRFDICPIQPQALKDRFLGVCPPGTAYFIRDPNTLVRFPYVDPRRDHESFAYLLLCEFIPFDTESQLLQNHPTYAAAAIHHGLADTLDKVRHHVTRHCKYVFASATITEDHVDQIAAGMHSAQPPPPLHHDVVLDLPRAHAIATEATAALPPTSSSTRLKTRCSLP